MTQTGGAVSAQFVDLSVPTGNGTSLYAISGGSLTAGFDLNVGGGGDGPAQFTQAVNSSTVTANGTLYVGNPNGNAVYTLTGGTLTTGTKNVNSDSGIGDVVIGSNGAGELKIGRRAAEPGHRRLYDRLSQQRHVQTERNRPPVRRRQRKHRRVRRRHVQSGRRQGPDDEHRRREPVHSRRLRGIG